MALTMHEKQAVTKHLGLKYKRARKNKWTVIAYANGEIYTAPTFDIEVVDRVGSGDSFAGGFLFGYLTDGPTAAVRYGIGVSALKQTNHGDLVWATREEVEHILDGGSLRIAR